MQIIGGKFRGKKIQFISSNETRPTTSRVRESIFNIIGSRIREAHVLDLFAGSGIFSIEAASRGAKSIITNDNCEKAFKIIKSNLNSVKQRCFNVFNLDFYKLLELASGYIKSKKIPKFDVVFLDPPYQSDFGMIAIDFLYSNQMISSGSVIVYETNKDFDLEIIGKWETFFNVKIKKYGLARVYCLSLPA
ncbi:MAG: 16S rRNA (guanine(966)-N(2))-methyltransferase RsmD [Firmicutes bacterium]|nr:16S rRNA (guanine(966)-N(2))-methyltransferase RsmD [Bacillota bacterium]